MTRLICSNMEFSCGFYVVSHLALIIYLFLIIYIFNTLPRNEFLQLYILISGLGYIHNYDFYTIFDIVVSCLSLYSTTPNQPVARSIIVKYFSIDRFILTFSSNLHGPIRSTKNMSQVMSYTSFAVKQLY